MALTKISTAMISQDAASVDLNIDAGTLYIDSTNNRVGVGSTSPSQALTVNGNIYSIGGFANVSGYQLNGTYIVDSSRNLVNIGTISSGAITMTNGSLTLTDGYNLQWGGAYGSGNPSISAASNFLAFYPTGNTDGEVIRIDADGIDMNSHNLTEVGNITTTGTLYGPATFTIDPSTHGDNTGTVVIAGNLQVDGTTTTINSTTVEVDDKLLVLGSGSTNAAAAAGGGIAIDRGSDSDATWKLNSVGTAFESSVPVKLVSSTGLGIGADATSFGSGVSTILLQGTNTTNGRAGALWFKEQDGSNTTALYSTDGADGYGTVLTAYQGQLKLGIGGLASSNIALAIDTNKNVGIGTTSPSNQFVIKSGTNTDMEFGSESGGAFIQTYNRSNSTYGYLRFITNGETMRLTNGGNVGIGTTAPSAPLDVQGSTGLFMTRTSSGLASYIENDGGYAAQYLYQIGGSAKVALHANGSSYFNGGNVGIGTSSPSYKFDVYGTDDVTMRIHRPSSGLAATDTCGIGFSHRSDTSTSTTDTRAGIFSTYNGDLFLAVEAGGNLNSNPMDHSALFIEGANGNIGIGTDSPSHQLHVAGAGDIVIEDTGGGSAHLRLKSSASGTETSHWKLKTNAANHFYIDNDQQGTNPFTILSGGNVGIGTTSPGQKLDVVGTIQSSVGLRVAGHPVVGYSSITGGYAANLGSTGTSTLNETHIYSGGTQRVVINGSGNVGIGTASPLEKLDVNSYTGISVNNNYAHMGSTVSGAMAIFGHNIKSDSANNTIKSANTGYHSSMIKMYYDQGITFHATSGTNTAGDTFYDLSGTTNELMRITNAGNVGIGTTSPASALSGSNRNLTIEDVDGSDIKLKRTAGMDLSVGVTSSNTGYLWTSTSSSVLFGTAGTERMRLNGSGDWIVSNTNPRVVSQFTNQAGIGWYEGDLHAEIGTTNNRSALEVGRNNATSGDVITIRQQSTSVGMIGTEGGDSLVIQSNGSTGIGLRFHPSTTNIDPVRQGARIDNTVSLGSSTHRFKDLYLSGGVYLGGTGSANKLDDYEEGTWDPTIVGSSGASGQSYNLQNGYYTKIGSFVHATFDVQLSTLGTLSGTYVVLGGLPFAGMSSNLGGTVNIGYSSGVTSGISFPIGAYISGGAIYLMETGEAANYILVSEGRIGNSSRLIGSIIMYTSN